MCNDHCTVVMFLTLGMNWVNGPSADTAVKTNGSATLMCRAQITDSSASWYTGSPFTSLETLIVADDPHYTSVQSAGGASSLTVTEFRNHRHGGDYTCVIASGSSNNALYSCPGSLTNASKSRTHMSSSVVYMLAIAQLCVYKSLQMLMA